MWRPPGSGIKVSCISRQILYHWATREAPERIVFVGCDRQVQLCRKYILYGELVHIWGSLILKEFYFKLTDWYLNVYNSSFISYLISVRSFLKQLRHTGGGRLNSEGWWTWCCDETWGGSWICQCLCPWDSGLIFLSLSYSIWKVVWNDACLFCLSGFLWGVCIIMCVKALFKL